ncbi:DUF4956 domain-containing protein [Erysipelothrix sp. HDW6C]|uniref:DUF4956 domain-containing protein n=1 Tax=Erysipelothrix sp. HDW6C TaxID=2714930 RepID=UPI00140DB34A|nr:DUF4956 domain-containing protein [Erysipelothrix sp. HDW6C]QIK69522.1 DUF4956 domain-containing protein [Erysipelothrix sp. HDW6C]
MIFESITQTTMTLEVVVICSVVSLLMGMLIAYVYMYKNEYSKSFVVTLALLPVMIQIVIMMVNGNLGTSVAVLGTFSLIRFRSVAGSARDIGSIFFAMAIGLANGMGFVSFSVMITLLIGGMSALLYTLPFGERGFAEKDLKIVIPESLDYDGIFDDIFSQYTSNSELMKVKTTNMGSLFELQYRVHLKNDANTKDFIDALRVRNGNLSIVCGRPAVGREEL